MPNYRETTTSATSWRRAYHVEIRNPLPEHGVPFVEFREEEVVRVANRLIAVPVGGASLPLAARYAPTEAIPIRNPETGELTGEQMTHAELYRALFSLYLNLAHARDAREAAAAAQPAQPAAPAPVPNPGPAVPATPQQP